MTRIKRCSSPSPPKPAHIPKQEPPPELEIKKKRPRTGKKAANEEGTRMSLLRPVISISGITAASPGASRGGGGLSGV